MNTYSLSIRPFGVHAILVEWPNKVQEAILEDILQFMECLKSNLDMHLWELVPAYNSLTLIRRGDPIDFEKFSGQLREWYDEKGTTSPKDKFLWRLPVCYDIDFGIDLEDVSQRLGMSIPELIDLHTKNTYTVFGIGFLPGFMYLGGLTSALEIPRKATPRLKVVKGAVGLAGRQTGIYPQESPGGWNIIGNCAIPIFDAKKNPPCLVKVGDKIQFYGISRAEHELHKIEGEVGIYQIEKIKIDVKGP
ncbi:5-oxoprolinase subunit PxpB [Flavobacteriaceae bacterium TP-CH-4]|uniref:5-oxoprolinase subunit PxpB n=1 Tax=Pelagihabitans pacificus TaxID=2696054 RepID=A0A967ATJ5_9FLAO|nr:5-oxoprolinase subunit PxpB [Pelagihabitans pacificus]NHF60126.1 5-oxoprolinase subunit PxpB [Pelagihabitans pacificus]